MRWVLNFWPEGLVVLPETQHPGMAISLLIICFPLLLLLVLVNFYSGCLVWMVFPNCESTSQQNGVIFHEFMLAPDTVNTLCGAKWMFPQTLTLLVAVFRCIYGNTIRSIYCFQQHAPCIALNWHNSTNENFIGVEILTLYCQAICLIE